LAGKYGFVDKTSREVVPCKYYKAKDFFDGLALVEFDGKDLYINKKEKEVKVKDFDVLGFMMHFGNNFGDMFEKR
jgi:hypothetical protein